VSTQDGSRWDLYVLHRQQALHKHWQRRFADGARVALIMGVGFDPRMCMALRMFGELAGVDVVAVHAVRFAAPGDVTARVMAEENLSEFDRLLGVRPVAELTVAGNGLDATARSAAAAVQSLDALGYVSDIVVDINALPRAVFFPLVAKLLYLCDQRGAEAPNLHIIGGDNAALDAEIEVVGIDEHASWLHPFEGSFGVEATAELPRVWMPILGENTEQQLERISDLVAPQEVCPLLPFPAKDPRRGDQLFDAYRGVLFDRLQTDSGTVIYADEANPFQVYRRLLFSTRRYQRTLGPLGGCKTAFSALSSKLVAIGALLVAYELREGLEVGIADIGAQLHRVQRHVKIEEAAATTELVGLSLSGDCYL
jgi:hypothetical protein